MKIRITQDEVYEINTEREFNIREVKEIARRLNLIAKMGDSDVFNVEPEREPIKRKSKGYSSSYLHKAISSNPKVRDAFKEIWESKIGKRNPEEIIDKLNSQTGNNFDVPDISKLYYLIKSIRDRERKGEIHNDRTGTDTEEKEA